MVQGRKDRFIHLDSVAGWRSFKVERLHEDETGFSLQRVPGPERPVVDNEGTLGGLDYPTGLALDSHANIYVADTEQHIIKKFDCYRGEFVTLACLGGKGSMPRRFDSPMGIAISRGVLYVADTGNHRVQAFYLKGLVLRDIWGSKKGKEEGSFNEPTDIAVDSRGDVYVVDSKNFRVQKFSPGGKFLLEFGKNGDGEGEFKKPSHIAIDKDDRVYVTDAEKEYVQVFDSKGARLFNIEGPEEARGSFRPLSIAIDAKGNVFVAEECSRSIFRFCRKDGAPASPPSYAGCSSGLTGPCSYLMVDGDGVLLAALEGLGLVRFEPEEFRYEPNGSLFSGPLDSKEYMCKWHRVLMDAEMPEEIGIEVRTYTSEKEENEAYIEGLDDSKWSGPRAGIDDFLVLSPPGRYLWLKVTLSGNLDDTPVLKELRVYYPRDSYLKYLPKVYQEDEQSREFLDRFLSIFETIFSSIEEKIDGMHAYFRPGSVPKDRLAWLASWLALVLDDNWSEEKKRRLIKRAARLYRKRGTVEGLRDYMEIYSGLRLPIIENYRLRRPAFLGDSILGCNSSVWGKGIVGRFQLGEHSRVSEFGLISTKDPLMDPFHHYAHRFSVIVPSSFCRGEKMERAIRTIVEIEKPAHTKYSICKVGPEFRVGVQSTIGVDSFVGLYPKAYLNMRSTLGVDCVLGESPEEKGPPRFRIGRRSRIGTDTLVN